MQPRQGSWRDSSLLKAGGCLKIEDANLSGRQIGRSKGNSPPWHHRSGAHSAPIPLNQAKSFKLVPKLALAYQVDALAGELGNSSLSASMPASDAGSFLTQGQNRGVDGLSIAVGADLVLSQSTALDANVNVETFSAVIQVG